MARQFTFSFSAYLERIRSFSISEPALAVEVALTVEGDYSTDETAIINTASKTITIPLASGNRFYRLRGTTATEILESEISSGNLVLTYE